MYCERIEICIVNEGEPLIVCSQVVAASHHQKISEHIFMNHARNKKPLPSKGLLFPQFGTTALRMVIFLNEGPSSNRPGSWPLKR
jgi:hypothetical protein